MYHQKVDEPMNTSGQDILPSSPIQINNNQIVPVNYQVMAMETCLRSNPQFILCPYCKQMTPTRTVRSMNYWNVMFCLCSPMLWGVTKIFRNKDLNCYDADHSCLSCGANLSKYKSC